MSVGETMIATAKGNPVPNIRWTRLSGNGPKEVRGRLLTISRAMAGMRQMYEVFAYNVIFGDRISLVSFIEFDVGE